MSGPIQIAEDRFSSAWPCRSARRRALVARRVGCRPGPLPFCILALLIATLPAVAQLEFQFKEPSLKPSGWTRVEPIRFGEVVESPADFTIDPLGRLLVLDSPSGRIWTIAATPGRPMTPFGASDQGARRFEIPTRVFARWGLHAYTLDPQARAVSVFDLEGRYEATFDLQRSLTEAGGPTDVEFADFVVDKVGSLIALDRLRGRILAFDSDGFYRRLLGEDLTGEERLVAPADIEVDAGGSFYVADAATGRIIKVGRQGSLERVWRLRDKEHPKSRPVAVSYSAGYLYVADAGEDRIVVLAPDGARVLEIPAGDDVDVTTSTRMLVVGGERLLLLNAGERLIHRFELRHPDADQ